MNSLKLILGNLKYFAPAWVFASLNIMLGTWVLYIPAVKARLGLNDAELGIALFSYALGILVVIPLISTITKRIGVGRYTIIGIILFALAFVLPFWAQSYLSLCISLFIVGLFSGSTDISMNALVSEIERQKDISMMSAAHGFFSLGGVIGAGIGSMFLIDLMSPKTHILTVAIIVIISNWILSIHFRNVKEVPIEKSQEKTEISRFFPLVIIAFIAFTIMGSEGAIENWSKLYLLDVINVDSESIAGYGFVLFSATMTLGRFFGDGISTKYGSDQVIIGGSLIAVVAYFAILSNDLYMALGGFALLGLGLSVIIPELFRVAGQAEGISPSSGIAFVSGIGFLGFLVGPVVMGFISNQAGLRYSFVALLGIIILATILAILRKAFARRSA
jgi:fucose permease